MTFLFPKIIIINLTSLPIRSVNVYAGMMPDIKPRRRQANRQTASVI